MANSTCTIADMIRDPDSRDDYELRDIVAVLRAHGHCVSPATVRRMIDGGDFGEVDVDWYWTRRKQRSGQRRVHADAVDRYLRETGLRREEDL